MDYRPCAFALAGLVGTSCFTENTPVAATHNAASTAAGTTAGPSGPTDEAGTEMGLESGLDAVDVTADSDGSATNGEPACPANGPCLPPPPAQWDGPFVVVAAPGDAPLAACPPQLEPFLMVGEPPFVTDPVPCVCSPGTPDCAVALTALVSAEADCGQNEQTLLGVGNVDCVQLALGEGFVGLSGPLGSCDGASAQAEPSPVQWSRRHQVCAPPSSLDCDGGVCGSPPAPMTRTCIMREGKLGCPAGPYLQQSVLFQAFADNRGCSPCTGQVDCGQVSLYDDPSCNGAPLVTWDVGVNKTECQPDVAVPDPGLESAQWSGGPPACDILQDTSPTGVIVTVDPVTLCCLPR